MAGSRQIKQKEVYAGLTHNCKKEMTTTQLRQSEYSIRKLCSLRMQFVRE
jgi:hypothetical protein